MSDDVDEVARDWRGTPIVEGATVIYGAPVGRSIAMVQGTVDGFTPAGRVWINVTHRAYGGHGHAPRVHVGPDRLTIVTTLPPTDLPTVAEAAERELANRVKYHQDRVDALDAGEAPRFQGETADYHRSRVEALSA